MIHLMQTLIDWLAGTRLSASIQNVSWIIPTVQTVHILCIGIVMSCVLMVNLQVAGLLSTEQPLAAAAGRFLPWVWYTLVILLLSGATLIVGEPARSLLNPAFLLKMVMLTTVLILMFVFQRGLRRDPLFWGRDSGRRIRARALAIVSLLLWTGIVFAGRWIAYINSDSG